jgi:hypothetical protein
MMTHQGHLTRSQREWLHKTATYQNKRKAEQVLEDRLLQQNAAARAERVRRQEAQNRFQLDVAKEQFDQDKELVFKWTELINKARASGNKGLETQLLAQGQTFIDNMNPKMQQLMAPILRAGPFDPREVRMRKYLEMHPQPRITADPTIEPYAYARQAQDLLEWESRTKAFKLGDKPTPIPSVVPHGEGLYLVTGDTPKMMSSEEYNIAAFAESHGSNLAEYLAYDGVPGEHVNTVINGQQITTIPVLRMDNKIYPKQISKGPTTRKNKQEDQLLEFTQMFGMWPELDKKVKERPGLPQAFMNELENQPIPAETISYLEDGKKITRKETEDERKRRHVRILSDKYIKPATGMNVILTGNVDKSGKIPFVPEPWTWLSKSQQGTLVVVPGERANTKHIPGLQGSTGVETIYDPSTEILYNVTTGAPSRLEDEITKVERTKVAEEEAEQRKILGTIDPKAQVLIHEALGPDPRSLKERAESISKLREEFKPKRKKKKDEEEEDQYKDQVMF